MANSFMRSASINVQITPAPITGSTSKQVLLIGQRNTNGTLIKSSNGFAQPNYYQPILLPSFSDGGSALNYIGNYGIKYSIGQNFTLTLPAPDNVSSVNALTTVTWDIIPPNFVALTGFNLTGTLSQSTPSVVNANVYSANIIAGIATMVVYGTVTYSTSYNSGGNLTLTAVNNIDYPDPNLSDPIALLVWDFYQSALSATKSVNGVPNAYISILSDRDSTITPVATPIVLGNPTSVNTSGSTAVLMYPIATAGLGYLPTTKYGNSMVTQAVTLPSDSTETIYYANGIYLRGSADGAGINYSTGGTNWTATNLTTLNVTSFYWNGSVYVATTSVGIYYSVNGISWTISTGASTGSFTDVYFANTKFVATSTAGLFYSSDGITWTECTGDAGASYVSIIYGIGSAGGKWIAVTPTADAYSSTDGISFGALTISTSGFNFVTFANGLFQLGGNADGIVYSSDGITFTASSLTTLSVYDIIYNGVNWLANTSVGIYTSINGISWTIATGASTGVFNQFAYNNNIIVSVSTAGIYESTNNGLSWTLCLGAGASGVYTSVVYNNNLFISGGTSGLSISNNGITWNTGSVNNSGIFNGYAINGSNVAIIINNVVGTFITTGSTSVILDNTINAFAFLDKINLYGAVQQFPIITLSDITTKYADFYNGIAAINEPNQVLNNHYFTYGGAGNVTILPSSASTLPAPNNQENILVSYPYYPVFGNVIYENNHQNVAAGRIASAIMYMLANGDAPFPPLMTATINHLPVSTNFSTQSYSGSQQGTGDIAVNQGWIPLAPNTSGVVEFLESVTTLITIPDSTVPDVEFRYTHVWDCIRWLKQRVGQLFEVQSKLPNNMGSALMSPTFLTNFQAGIVSILVTGEKLGIFENVALYQNLVSVTQDSINPNQVDAYVPCQIIPQINNANININVFSSLIQFSNNQGA